MIQQLRRRMTLLVTGVLVLVSAGIVLGIYEVNNRNIVAQAESALEALAENSGVRPVLPPGRRGSASKICTSIWERLIRPTCGCPNSPKRVSRSVWPGRPPAAT